MPHIGSVSIMFFVGAGSRYEAEDEIGISHYVEHVLFRGTSQWPTAREISEAIEGVGGIINGATDKELTLYWCKVAKPNFSLALKVLADMVLQPRFDPGDIEKERQVIVEEINTSRDSPSQRVHMIIDELLWPDHPLGRDIAGNKETVSAITQDQMLAYLGTQYQPASIVVAIAGDVQHQPVVTAVSQLMAGWENRQPRGSYLAYHQQEGRQVNIEARDTEQAHLCLALPGLSLVDPRRFVIDLLNVVLGEGMSSRLFTEVRDRLGLAYSIHSFIDHFLDTGAMTIGAAVEPQNLPVAIQAILEQLDQLKQPVSPAELIKAKELSKGRLMLRMEDSRNVAGWIGGQEVLTGNILTVDEVISRLEAITAEDLSQLAGELFHGDRLRLAVVGPVADDPSLTELLRM